MIEVVKATSADIDRIVEIYDAVLSECEAGRCPVGWERGVYPERKDAEAALARDDLYVAKQGGVIISTGIINQMQLDVYAETDWEYEADDSEVMVLHTLATDPAYSGSGAGTAIARYYEDYAREHGCKVLRIDTQAQNNIAREFYKRLGYREAGILPCMFNGIQGVNLVMLEKKL